jgi:hypothetical protein
MATNHAPNLNDMTEIIRNKERELHHYQDLRNAQLEALLAEREKILLQTKQKFELLKDDFNYNLQLIEARDREIQRLEQLAKVHMKKEEELEQKVRSMQTKETERFEKAEQDKMLQKVRLYLLA